MTVREWKKVVHYGPKHDPAQTCSTCRAAEGVFFPKRVWFCCYNGEADAAFPAKPDNVCDKWHRVVFTSNPSKVELTWRT